LVLQQTRGLLEAGMEGTGAVVRGGEGSRRESRVVGVGTPGGAGVEGWVPDVWSMKSEEGWQVGPCSLGIAAADIRSRSRSTPSVKSPRFSKSPPILLLREAEGPHAAATRSAESHFRKKIGSFANCSAAAMVTDFSPIVLLRFLPVFGRNPLQ